MLTFNGWENYRNYPFFVVEIFSNGTCPKICYSNIILVRKFFSVEGSWLMVANGLSFLDHGNSIPGAHIGELSRALHQLSNSRCPSIFVTTHDSHPRSLAKYLFFIALGKAYRNPARCSFVVQTCPKSV